MPETLLSEAEQIVVLGRAMQEALTFEGFSDPTIATTLRKEAIITFQEMFKLEPGEVNKYFFPKKRTYGFLNSIYNHYIQHLENLLPLTDVTNPITSLLDSRLCLFESEVCFEQKVENSVILNHHDKWYLGSRNQSTCKRYFLGKVISLHVDSIDVTSSLLHHTFHRIQVKPGLEDRKVHVRAYLAPPHYEMGGLMYLGQARRRIMENLEDYFVPS